MTRSHPDADALTALIDLGVVEDRADFVRKLQERRAGVIADLIAIAEMPAGLADVSRDALREACRKELDLCEEALDGLGEPYMAVTVPE